MAAFVPGIPLVQEAFGERFRIVGTLRLGGQALVLRAVRTSVAGAATEQEVALKLYLDRTQDERVTREIEAATEARHFTLANLLEHGTIQIDGRSFRYLVWEFIPGNPLDVRISDGAQLSPRVVAIVGRDIATAIDAIWAKRIVHRDVNPKNVILRAGDESAVLIDLGIAKYINLTPLTAPGVAWGTAGYLSPEQMLGLELTCHSDVFSLGITLHQAISGRHPTNYDQGALFNGGRRTADAAPNAPARLAAVLDLMVSQRAAHRPYPAVLIQEFNNILKVF